MSNDQKICRNCEHWRPTRDFDMCVAERRIDVVSGDYLPTVCISMRGVRSACGPDAKLYEEQKPMFQITSRTTNIILALLWIAFLGYVAYA